MTAGHQEKIAIAEGTAPYRVNEKLRAGAFYWVRLKALHIEDFDRAKLDWQPARYTGRSGTTVGDTWDVIGFESTNSHHFVEVIEIGDEVCPRGCDGGA